MTEKTTMQTKVLASIFFVSLIAAIVLVAKATLSALGIYSSTSYSVVYFSLLGAAFIFTKYVYVSMFRVYQYVALAISVTVSGIGILWLFQLH